MLVPCLLLNFTKTLSLVSCRLCFRLCFFYGIFRLCLVACNSPVRCQIDIDIYISTCSCIMLGSSCKGLFQINRPLNLNFSFIANLSINLISLCLFLTFQFLQLSRITLYNLFIFIDLSVFNLISYIL